jgi:hypothetical protein
MNRVGAGLAVVLLAGSSAVCPAQDVVYSQADGSGYSRYEQYGFGRNAVVRYQGIETNPYAPGVSIQTEGYQERLGAAPAFGTFAGTRVSSQGPSPVGLYRGLGPGARTQGQIRNTVISQPYTQWTPYGYVVVQPQPYIVRVGRSEQAAQASFGPAAAAPMPGARALAAVPTAAAPVPAAANAGRSAARAPAAGTRKPTRIPGRHPSRPVGKLVVPPPPTPVPPPEAS